MKRVKHETSNFYCTDCNFKFPLSRKSNRRREIGHVKDLYCPGCGTIKKFTESRVVDFK